METNYVPVLLATVSNYGGTIHIAHSSTDTHTHTHTPGTYVQAFGAQCHGQCIRFELFESNSNKET